MTEAEAATEGNTSITEEPKRRNYAWASLMMRVFKLDVLECERCGARLRIVAAIQPPEATEKILTCLGLPAARRRFHRPGWSQLPNGFRR